MFDNKRDPDNTRKETLAADTNAAEYTSAAAGTNLQFYANGFRPGGSGADMNGNNETYIFIAFASMPFKNSHAQ